MYFDRTQVGLGSAALEDCALTVLATVVSKPSADRIILDCGSKTLSSDPSPLSPGYGGVLTRDGSAIDEALTIERLSEEHATVAVRGGTTLEPGDRVRVLPNHSCVVSNLADEIRLVEGDPSSRRCRSPPEAGQRDFRVSTGSAESRRVNVALFTVSGL